MAGKKEKLKSNALRASVRTIVEFTLHPSDILPAAMAHDRMAEGRMGHTANQLLHTPDWQIEKAIALDGETDGTPWHILGRMDAFLPGEVPVIEELKLAQAPPDAPLPAHRAQAVCYGHIVLATENKQQAVIRVVYVTTSGESLAVFEETLNAAACREAFFSYLNPFVADYAREARRLSLLQNELRRMPFPYPAYRPGQREMAVQVYTAIRLKKRLFAQMPTGTGKSAASLFPALKALGEGLTPQIFYLTARATARLAPMDFLIRLQESGVPLHVLTLTAKDKLCPTHARCHPDFCPRAKGHFDRQEEALMECAALPLWTEGAISAIAEKHRLCPFEFSLTLSERADVVLCDYNYAFDPAVQLERIFGRRKKVTLLIDEAHHLTERVRASLSGEIRQSTLRRLRKALEENAGTHSPLYAPVMALLKLFRPLGKEERVLESLPENMQESANDLLAALRPAMEQAPLLPEGSIRLFDVYTELLGFLSALDRTDEDTRLLYTRENGGGVITVFAPDPAMHIRQITKSLSGAVFFSATLTPLEAMKTLLGGEEADACYLSPSPYPPENLLVLRQNISTRYDQREQTAQAIADAISAMANHTPGNYLAFLPSYKYLQLVLPLLHVACQVNVQEREMDEETRQQFLNSFLLADQPVLGLCVLGGIFSEGIDLPGKRLIGAAVVGLGLPVPSPETEVLRACYDKKLGNGFYFASQVRGMQKVAQAAGRVIRSENDKGVVLLLDDRYSRSDVVSLCPPHWYLRQGDIKAAMDIFYQKG